LCFLVFSRLPFFSRWIAIEYLFYEKLERYPTEMGRNVEVVQENQDVDCKRYEEVDGVRKEKERLTTDHQPPTVLQTRESILLSQAWSGLDTSFHELSFY